MMKTSNNLCSGFKVWRAATLSTKSSLTIDTDIAEHSSKTSAVLNPDLTVDALHLITS